MTGIHAVGIKKEKKGYIWKKKPKMQNFLISMFNIQTINKSKHIQNIQGRQLDTCTLYEFRSFNSKTQI